VIKFQVNQKKFMTMSNTHIITPKLKK